MRKFLFEIYVWEKKTKSDVKKLVGKIMNFQT